MGAAVALLLLGFALSACGATPVAETWPGLTVDGDTVYVISGSPQQVYLLDAVTGIQKASFIPQGDRKGIVYWGPVTVGEGLAFVGFAEAQAKTYRLYAFDPKTAQELWHVPAEDLILAAPAYADGTVYYGSSDGRVYAVDVASHALKPGWTFQAEEAIWATPLVADGRLYVASMDHHLYCLDAEDGRLIWDFEAGGAMAAQPVLDGRRGVLYVGAFDGRLYAVHAESGQPVEGFAFRAENWIWSEVLATEDRLYVTSLDGRLYALDPASGALIPPYPYDAQELADQDESVRAAPVQAEDSIVIATQLGKVIAVQDGRTLWHWPSSLPQGPILTTPVISEGTVYVVLSNGLVQTLDAATGAQGWSFAPPQG